MNGLISFVVVKLKISSNVIDIGKVGKVFL